MNATILPTDVFIEYLGHQRLIVDVSALAAAVVIRANVILSSYFIVSNYFVSTWSPL